MTTTAQITPVGRVGALIHEALLDRGWTQGDLAEASGVDQSNISKIMNGQRHLASDPRSRGKLRRIARALDLPLNALDPAHGAESANLRYRIRSRRMELGIAQSAAAEMARVGRGTWRRYECDPGYSPSAQLVRDMAAAVGLHNEVRHALHERG